MELLAIVKVERENRVYCQINNCNRLLTNIYVVQDRGELTVIGSECFKKTYPEHDGKPMYTGGGSGQLLSEDERELFIKNTAAFIEKMKQAHAEQLEEARLRQARLDKIALEEEEYKRQVETNRAKLEQKALESIQVDEKQRQAFKNAAREEKRLRSESMSFEDRPIPKGMEAFVCGNCSHKYHWMDLGSANACRNCGSKKVKNYFRNSLSKRK